LAHDAAVVARLDRAVLGIRRAVLRPELASLPIPALQKRVDFAKVLACFAIAELHADAPQGPPVSVKDVARSLELEHSTTSRLLGDAEAEGLVQRTTDPQDRRRTLVRLTDTGRIVVEQSAAIRMWAIDRVLAEWSSEEIVDLAENLERFAATAAHRTASVFQAAAVEFGLADRRPPDPGPVPHPD
jgi:DNA-binding MarR family transcriptional regulator